MRSDQPNATKTPGAHSANDPADERQLVYEMKDGQERAFAVFYDRFAHRLFSFISAILHDPKESEGVLEQAFLEMWRRIRTYDPTRNRLFTWAVMISRQNAIERLVSRPREDRARFCAPDDLGANTPPKPLESADKPVTWESERERVKSALGHLSGEEREAIDLAFFGGLNQRELAETLAVPVSNLGTRIGRALVNFRNLLDTGAS